MYFFDGFMALADRLGMVPDDVLVLSYFAFALYLEILSWCFVFLYRFLRWFVRFVGSLFKRRKEKKAAD